MVGGSAVINGQPTASTSAAGSEPVSTDDRLVDEPHHHQHHHHTSLVEVYDAHKKDAPTFKTYKVGLHACMHASVADPFLVPFPNSTPSLTPSPYRQRQIRWFMLFIYAILTISNAAIWTSYAPIAQQSATYFGTSTTGINMLSMIYMIVYVPGVCTRTAIGR